MKPAPVFSPQVTSENGVIGSAFSAWVAHYNSCEYCQREDWYEPTVSRLCHPGSKLFTHWNDVACQGRMPTFRGLVK